MKGKIIFAYVVFLFHHVSVLAANTINIERGQLSPTPVAINKFSADNINDDRIGNDIVEVIINDLRLSGLFRPLSAASFIEETKGINHRPLFAAWRQINATLLLNGDVSKIAGNKVKISFILWDTTLEKRLIGEVLEVPENLWRRAAHKVADKIYEKITGDPGYFDTKMVYVSETGPYLKRVKRIALMDHDGHNHRYLTDGKSMAVTPRFTNENDKILYVSYDNRKVLVYEHNLRTGKRKILGNFTGMSFAPRFSPEGRKAVMSIARNGSTHIYEIDLITGKLHKLTDGFGINTSPSYSPDGKKIVFNSDRSGSRQLYTMNTDGTNVKRISFGTGAYAAPNWSPRGDYIAFTKISKAIGFTIGVMRPDGEGDERIITNGYLVEGPCWSPNGRVIMFTKGWPSKGNVAGKSRLYAIDLTGYNERAIKTPHDASDPEWSNVFN